MCHARLERSFYRNEDFMWASNTWNGFGIEKEYRFFFIQYS